MRTVITCQVFLHLRSKRKMEQTRCKRELKMETAEMKRRALFPPTARKANWFFGIDRKKKQVMAD